MPVSSFGDEFTINELGAGDQAYPHIVELPDGRLLFVWQSLDPMVDGDGAGISARVGSLQIDGSIAWSSAGEVTVNEQVSSNQYTPRALVLTDGRILVTWHSGDPDIDGNAGGIAARVGTVQSDGGIVWGAAGEFSVNGEQEGLQDNPRTVQLTDGRVLFVWSSNDPDVDGSGAGIVASFATIGLDGSVTWAPANDVTINQAAVGDQLHPAVIELNDGRLLFTWTTNDPSIDLSGTGVSARIGTPQADGSITWEITGEFRISDDIFGGQYEPQVVQLEDGRLLFAWDSVDPDIDGVGAGITTRVGRFQFDGQLAWDGDEVTVNQQFAGDQIQVKVTLLADGRVLFTWWGDDPDVDGSVAGVSGRIGSISSLGQISWSTDEFTINQQTQAGQAGPQTIALSDGRIVTVWWSEDPDVDGSGAGISGRVINVDYFPDARADTYSVGEDDIISGGNVFADSGAGADGDADGDAFSVAAVNGVALNVGQQVVLGSGALLTVNANGTFAYDPNDRFEYLGAGQTGYDYFTYTIATGDGRQDSARVTIEIGGASEPPPASGEIVVNQETEGQQITPQITVLPDSRLLFVWQSFEPSVDGTSSGISARVGTPQTDGSILWASAGELTVNVETLGGQREPQALVLADGRVLFTWSSVDVSARVGSVLADGSISWATAGEVTVNSTTGGGSRQQAIALEDGRVFFTWGSNTNALDGFGSGVAGRVGSIQSDGSIVWVAADVSISAASTHSQSSPDVILLDDGRLVAAWMTHASPFQTSFISARVGTPQENGLIVWGAEFVINQSSPVFTFLRFAPRLADLGDGRVLFTWANDNPSIDGDANAISARIGVIEPDGDIAWSGAEFRVNQQGVAFQEQPQAVALGDGRILFVWQSNSATAGATYDVVGRIGAPQANGSIVWEAEGEFVISRENAVNQMVPQVQLLEGGRVIFTWHSNDPDIDGDMGIASLILDLNFLPVARNDAFAVAEDASVGGNLLSNNGSGADSDADANLLTVVAVNGSSLNVGAQIELASGALVMVSGDGAFTYSANDAFGLGLDASTTDSFTYTVHDGYGGTSTATVSFAIGSVSQTLSGSPAPDALDGQAGNDVIFGQGGGDTLLGGDGDDTLIGGTQADALNGGGGSDTASYVDASGAVVARLNNAALNTGDAAGDTYVSIENLTGSAFGDTLAGDAQANRIRGEGGVDTISGNDGNDVLYGDAGNDTLDGGNDADTLNGGDNADTLYGRAGNDTLDGGAGSNTLEGGGGDDTYIVRGASDVIVELSASGTDTIISTATRTLGNFQENLTLTGVAAINGFGNTLANAMIGNDAANTLNGLAGADTLSGGLGTDTLNGGDGADTLNGGGDNDVLDGGNDADTLNGGDGADTLFGRTQNDILNGDGGNDTIFCGDGDDVATGGDGDDLIDGLNNNDTLSGGDGADDLYGRQNNDVLNGDAGNDDLYGGDGDDQLNGGADDDLLDGGNGIDVLNGGDGADTLYGRNGVDTLDGGLGADTLLGGNDADTFVFSSALGGGNIDTIQFYSAAEDTIQLDVDVFSAIGLGTLAANAFVIGTAAADADDRIIYDAATGALYYDADGDGAGAAVQFATLGAGLALTNADFVGGP